MNIKGEIPETENCKIKINNKQVDVVDGKFNFNFNLFKSGGGLKESFRLNIPLLAEIPYSEDLMLSIDNGEPLVFSSPESEVGKIFINIAKKITK